MINVIRPQEGYQLNALSSPADIVIGGGAAGVGKTFTMLLEPLKHITTVRDFGGVIFRRTSPQIRAEGGLWDASKKLYSYINNTLPRESTLEWLFSNNGFTNKLKFSHLEYDKNVYDWQGSEIPFIGFDELTHFSESMFFYLLTRNRSTCGVRPYVRATCNPDPDSWVAEFISWWIGEDGFPIPDRSGKIRYFLKNGSNIIDGNSFEDVYNNAKFVIDEQISASNGLLKPENLIKSYTFVSGSIYDNKKLLEVNADYLGNLMSLTEDEKNKLLLGNWKVSTDERNLLKHDKFVGMFHNNIESKTKDRRICADIALEGSNKMAVMYFEGKRLEDIDIIDRSNGKQVIEAIKKMQAKHRVTNDNTIFDADGVGGFVGGYIQGANSYHGNGAVLEVRNKITGKLEKPNYQNLKTQLYYECCNDINNDEFTISEYVANKMYDKSMTVRQRLTYEKKCLKKAPDSDGKRKIINKEEMKGYLKGGESPDLWDTFVQIKWFDYKKTLKIYS